MEIILVDGKSVDKTIPIGQEILEKSGIAFKFFNDEEKGLGYARQIVVDAARGEYVCWVDSDNVVPRSFLKTHAEFAKNNSNVSLFISLILFKENRLVGKLEGYRLLLPSLNAVGTQRMPHIAMQGTFVSLKALRSVGGFDKSIDGA